MYNIYFGTAPRSEMDHILENHSRISARPSGARMAGSPILQGMPASPIHEGLLATPE